jgi:hypothetical protein
MPSVQYASIGKRTVLNSEYLSRPSPCGLNCTYLVSFPAPSLRCADANLGYKSQESMQNNSAALRQTHGYNTNFTLDQADFMAFSGRDDNTFLGSSSYDYFLFALSFRVNGSDTLRNISCITMSAMYNINITYINGVQTVPQINTTNEVPLNATSLLPASLFYDVLHSEPHTDAIRFPTNSFKNYTEAGLNSTFTSQQMQTIVDTMGQTLEGAISSFGRLDKCPICLTSINKRYRQ